MDDHPCGLQKILYICACGCKYLQGKVSENFICVFTALGLQPVQQHVYWRRCAPSFKADNSHRTNGSILYLPCLGDSSLLVCHAVFTTKRIVSKDLSAFSENFYSLASVLCLLRTQFRLSLEHSRSVFLNRRAAARYRALVSIILGRERPEETTICYKISLVQLITNLNVLLYLSTCHTVYISVLIFFMIMP